MTLRCRKLRPAHLWARATLPPCLVLRKPQTQVYLWVFCWRQRGIWEGMVVVFGEKLSWRWFLPINSGKLVPPPPASNLACIDIIADKPAPDSSKKLD